MNFLRERFADAGAVNVLGVRVNPVNMGRAAALVVDWAHQEGRGARYVCVTGVHGVIEAQRDDSFRRILNTSSLNVPDGMPMVWAGKWAGFPEMGRVYGPDFMLEICKQSAGRGLKHFFYGGNDGVAENLAAILQRTYPGLSVAGTHCPPFRSLTEQELDDVIRKINAATPDIVWIGLSTPKQERWMSSMVNRIDRGVLLGVGAAFDYNTGTLLRAPRWMQNYGLEWLYRLMQEPRRLFKRYLKNNPIFVMLIVAQLLGFRRRDIGITNQETQNVR